MLLFITSTVLWSISSTVLWSIALTEAFQCTEYSHSGCSGDPNAVIFSINTSRDKCQQYCHITDECQFYRYNAKPVQGITCSLYREPFRTFFSHCNIRAGPPPGDLVTCKEPTEGSCEVVQSGLCIFYGLTIESFDLPNLEDCEVLCLINPECGYWVYHKEEQYCELLDSSDKDCNEIFGPPSLAPAECGIEGESTTPPPTHSTPEIPIDCPPSGLETYPDPDDCGSYWECYYGVLTHMSCSYCYRYAADSKSCEMPASVECGSRPADDSCQSSPAPGACPYPSGYFKDPDNCMMYYHCAEGHLIAQHTCEKKEQNGEELQLLYNYKDMWCDWYYRVSCEERPICENHTMLCQCQGAKPANATDLCRDYPTGIQHLADPFNCSRSIICQEGHELIEEKYSCQPDQYYYNEKTEECTTDESVCGTRPICTEKTCRCHVGK